MHGCYVQHLCFQMETHHAYRLCSFSADRLQRKRKDVGQHQTRTPSGRRKSMAMDLRSPVGTAAEISALQA